MKKYRELAEDLIRAGFRPRPAKGSHVKFEHEGTGASVVLKFNHPGRDAGRRAERDVEQVLRRVKE